MADALGVLPKSPWHLHPHFHTHHLLPTTSICDIPALGFLWPQKHAWPIWGTGYNLGALTPLTRERQEDASVVLPQQRKASVEHAQCSLPGVSSSSNTTHSRNPVIFLLHSLSCSDKLLTSSLVLGSVSAIAWSMQDSYQGNWGRVKEV